MGPGIVATFEELSQKEANELGPRALVVVGPDFFFFDIWGLAVKEWESLVPAYTSSSIFCKKLRSGDAGERNNVSGERGSGFPVAVICCPGFSGCFPESHPWVLSLGAVVVHHSLSVMSSVGRAQLV